MSGRSLRSIANNGVIFILALAVNYIFKLTTFMRAVDGKILTLRSNSEQRACNASIFLLFEGHFEGKIFFVFPALVAAIFKPLEIVLRPAKRRRALPVFRLWHQVK